MNYKEWKEGELNAKKWKEFSPSLWNDFLRIRTVKDQVKHINNLIDERLNNLERWFRENKNEDIHQYSAEIHFLKEIKEKIDHVEFRADFIKEDF